MKRILTLSFILIAFNVFSQRDHVAVGLRTLGAGGITIKTTDDNLHGLELMMDFYRDEVRLTGLVERQKFILTDRISHFYLYWGGGAHFGITSENDYYWENQYGGKYLSLTRPLLGGDGIIGCEYRFESVPFEIALDNLSSLDFVLGDLPRFNMININFKIRYVLNHPKKLDL